jgi:hypothetical protein
MAVGNRRADHAPHRYTQELAEYSLISIYVDVNIHYVIKEFVSCAH